MRRIVLIALLLLPVWGMLHAQRADNYPPKDKTITIDHTNLPIVWIDVNGVMIERENRITARMKIIHNGDGHLNYADTVAHPGQHIDYEGYVGLRYRGNSSFAHSRKPYSFHTLTAPYEEGGEKKKVKILGMGKDNKWALLAPYSDRSLLRDLFAFEVSRPWMEYTPQGRFCELYLDGIYYGVYVLTEVVSKGKHRLNLDDPGDEGDALTGGYLMEVDRYETNNVYISKHHPVTNSGEEIPQKNIYFQYDSPDYEDMTDVQLQYIQGRIDEMENVFASPDYRNPQTGYRKYIDVMSFVDYQIAMEFGHNVDAYRLSGKFFKRRDSVDARFKMVLWDMDIAYGSPYYLDGWRSDKWSYELNDSLLSANESNLIPFWWHQLNADPYYKMLFKQRWAQYRRSNLQTDNVMALLDSLVSVVTADGAVDRNTLAWPRWGKYVWPNKYTATSYADEIAHLRQWLLDRIEWMDEQLGFSPDVLLGDVDMSGTVDVGDVVALIGYVLTTDEVGADLAAADCNDDGYYDVSDVTMLIDMVLQNPPSP